MSSERYFVAKSLLARVPQHERSAAVLDAVNSLGSETSGDIDLTVSLLDEHPDAEARQQLLKQLLWVVEAGHVDRVLSVCARNVAIRDELRGLVTDQLVVRAARLQPGNQEHALLTESVGPLTDGDASLVPELGRTEPSSDTARSLLNFIKRVVPLTPRVYPSEMLFGAVIVHLSASDEKSYLAARDALFSMTGGGLHLAESRLVLLWDTIQMLVAPDADHSSRDLGYSIWLRLISTAGFPHSVLRRPTYWTMLQEGLRYGDGERRKQCLGILRCSVAIAVTNETMRDVVCSAVQPTLGPNDVVQQYERYCTVFETVLLGRYLNQILECESDLDMLSSTQSAVRPEWLYALLAAALPPQMQDSVRKFIGGWIMRSGFQPDTSSEGFLRFFRKAFLPWAIQGSLYTTTLQEQDGRLVCGHGERLASYIARVIHCDVESKPAEAQTTDALLDVLCARQSGNFAYASVHLLAGLRHAFEATPKMILQPTQLQMLVGLSRSQALPEVARDYVHVCCISLCADSLHRSSSVLETGPVAEAARRWDRVRARLTHHTISTESATNEPIATWDSELSKRDSMELRAIEKCKVFRKRLATNEGLAASEARTDLDDIWSDLEYLEYPKRLLVDMPALIMDCELIRLAMACDELATSISKMVRKLQSLSKTRLYLLSPLVCAVRRVVLTLPAADQILPLEDLILHYAEHLPEATVDLQLEHSTALLLSTMAPELQHLGYKYYFGLRESVGVAALLDLVSRLRPRHCELAKSIFDRLLRRWVEQRTPPPAVSSWKSTLQLQVMLLCSEQIIPTLDGPDVLSALRDLHYILSIEPLPRYRYLLGWTVARIYLKHEDTRAHLLSESATKDHHSNPKYLASLMKIGVIVAKLEDSGADFGLQLASVFIALAASSKVVVRHEAQWQMPVLMDHARAAGWAEIVDNPAFAALDEYIRNLARFEDPPPERLLDRLDPVADHTLANLVEGRWFGLDSIEPPSCGRDDFLKLYQADEAALGEGIADFSASCMPLGPPILTPTAQDPAHETKVSAAEPDLASSSKASESRALQTKGTAYLTSSTADTSEPRTRPHYIIVVASLVDNPYNLGGLSRVSEIFGAAELHLPNRNVVSSKDFIGVAVSSHLHLPIHQLPAPGVPAYLAAKRDQGWTIVGIEQTDRSVLLGSAACKFPEKVVLVMGSEREGIPALVLTECDVLVEIPQQGVTRSLNVQTACSVVLYEYTRQHQQLS